MMKTPSVIKSALMATLSVITIFGIASCGGSSSSEGGDPVPVRGITVNGALDNATIQIGAADRWDAIRSAFASFFLKSVQAAVANVDTIIASSASHCYFAAINGANFSLVLPPGDLYVIGFYKGTQLIGQLQLDAATGLDTIPVQDNSGDVNLGTISLNPATGIATGTISQADLFADLGIDANTAASIGVADDEFLANLTVDVDGNGDIDGGNRYDFVINYFFDPGQTFSSLNNWSDKSLASFLGYLIAFFAYPDLPALDWANARLSSPQNINGENNKLGESTITNKVRVLHFYFNPFATAPFPPPQGTYVVTANPQNFTFNDVTSIAIDLNMNNVFVPVIKLTFDANGKVTTIQWQIWKKTSDIWAAATDDELAILIDNMNFQIAETEAWDQGPWLMMDIPLSAAGAANVPYQNFIPAVGQIRYETTAGYAYSFVWR